MNKKILMLAVAGMLLGFSVGLGVGIIVFEEFIYNYTDKCVEQFDLCVERLNQYDPMLKYNSDINISMEGWEYE